MRHGRAAVIRQAAERGIADFVMGDCASNRAARRIFNEIIILRRDDPAAIRRLLAFVHVIPNQGIFDIHHARFSKDAAAIARAVRVIIRGIARNRHAVHVDNDGAGIRKNSAAVNSGSIPADGDVFKRDTSTARAIANRPAIIRPISGKRALAYRDCSRSIIK